MMNFNLASVIADIKGVILVTLTLLIISVICKLFFIFKSKIKSKIADEDKNEQELIENNTEDMFTQGGLKLIDVDEKTAALIMAIVSDESSIPLSELSFKSIKLMN